MLQTTIYCGIMAMPMKAEEKNHLNIENRGREYEDY